MTELEQIKADIVVTKGKLDQAEIAGDKEEIARWAALLTSQQTTLNLLLSRQGNHSIRIYSGRSDLSF